MRFLVVLTLSCPLLLAASVRAQDKTTSSGGGVQAGGREAAALQPGARVTLKRKGGETVTGTLVWQDRKNNRVFVRTRPGERPTAVAMSELEGAPTVVPVAGSEDKGGVRPAADVGGSTLPAGEIHTLEVYNGRTRTMHYVDNSLSPAERARLADLEAATNRVADAEATVDQLAQSLADNPGGTTQQETINVVTTPPAYYLPTYYSPALYPYLYPVNYYTQYNYVYNPMLPFYNPMLPVMAPPMVSMAPTTTVVMQNRTTTAPSSSDLARALSAAQERLTQARERYVAVSNYAVMSDGRVVAVRLED